MMGLFPSSSHIKIMLTLQAKKYTKKGENSTVLNFLERQIICLLRRRWKKTHHRPPSSTYVDTSESDQLRARFHYLILKYN